MKQRIENRTKNRTKTQSENRPMYKLNYKPSPRDPRDYTLLSAPYTNSVLSVDLSSKCTSVRNQSQIGSCAAHAGVALLEYNLKNFAADKRNDIFSELFTYYVVRVKFMDKAPTDDSGSDLRAILDSFVKYGSCLENFCPYVIKDFSKEPSVEAYQNALNYQALTYLVIPGWDLPLSQLQNTLITLKGVLQSGYPFVGAFICYSNLYTGVGGNIPMPGNNPSMGGHAVLFVGYDDNRQVFKFKNSWGTDWGDNGYGYISYQYLLAGNLYDSWIIYTQENNNQSIGTVQPAPRPVDRKNWIVDTYIMSSNNMRAR
jgi:C1A family cysteine protease